MSIKWANCHFSPCSWSLGVVHQSKWSALPCLPSLVTGKVSATPSGSGSRSKAKWLNWSFPVSNFTLQALSPWNFIKLLKKFLDRVKHGNIVLDLKDSRITVRKGRCKSLPWALKAYSLCIGDLWGSMQICPAFRRTMLYSLFNGVLLSNANYI